MTALTLLPAVLLAMTSFTRIIIVLSILRQAMGTAQTPSNQILVGLALYSSAFVWLGLATTQAIGVGLLYIVLWEGFFTTYISGVRLFSIRAYSIALMHGLDERRFADTENLDFGVTVGVSVVVFVGFLLLTIRRLRNMDVP